MRASEFIVETWPVVVAKWFDILRKSQKFKHLPDDKIQQMATRAAQREVAPAQKATTPTQSLKDRFNQHRQEMSDEEFQDYYGFGKWDNNVVENYKDGRVKKAGAVFYHGTSSRNVPLIQKLGFDETSYFTTSLDDAEYYAATGGEWELQQREEDFEEKHGFNPRNEYDPWDMYELLYPKGEYPVVIEVRIPDEIVSTARKDSGAEGAIVFDTVISPKYISDVKKVEWQSKAVGVAENFADGKVKGKSRPGRVKKAGASCKGSVSHLRKMAKKYGGEKGKMYHWCLNMKAGKQKKK